MKKSGIVTFFLFISGFIFAQQQPQKVSAPQNVSVPQKFALVIGNAAYSSVRLKNSVNDANDIAAALEDLGFTVDKVTDGSLNDMERAITRLKNRLSVSKNAYGFFFYAGHGVQSNGVNYLIPIGANISGENYLRERAVSVQTMLYELNDAGNDLNVVVLDACRDNPYDWGRGRSQSSRGLAIVSNQPADSIIVYATSAGSTASDGEGRNGLFTSQLLKNLRTPGLEVSEVFRLTGLDVSQVSGREQIPAVYSQFFGRAYLGSQPLETMQPAVQPVQPVETVTVQPVPVQPAQPVKPVQPPEKERNGNADRSSKLWSVGVSLGTTFSAPWLVGTVHGTIAPFRHSFLDAGVDFGFVSGHANVNYYSFYPFGHYAFFLPFRNIGWFAGAGGGCMIATHRFPDGEFRENTFAGDVCAGIILRNMLNISYTLRTNFKSASNKLEVGYIKRF